MEKLHVYVIQFRDERISHMANSHAALIARAAHPICYVWKFFKTFTNTTISFLSFIFKRI